MALPELLVPELLGSANPRISPPRPLHHELEAYRQEALALGIDPMPWQDTATVYISALASDGRLMYREFAAVVGRQNGKTTLVKPVILKRLKAGRHIMHIAQIRDLPRMMFEELADALEATDPDLFPKRRGKIIWPRRGAGSESIVLTTGGTYRIAAAFSGSARGHSIDDLIIDELREMDSFNVINAAKPAQRFSEDPQTIYLSNAGTDESVVLNSLRDRAAEDPSLAYLEWSADPDYAADDRRGWAQANPAIGHYPQVLRDLEKDYVSASLSGNIGGFETESLCRWVPVLLTPILPLETWANLHGELEPAYRPFMGVSLDPQGVRASAVLAWQMSDGRVAVRLIADVTGDPIDVPSFGAVLKERARVERVRLVGFDAATDAELAKYFRHTQAITGQQLANASSMFVNLAESDAIAWDGDTERVGPDLKWTGRKDGVVPGSWTAVKVSDEHPVTAALAAIRAIWLASGPKRIRARVM